MYITSLLTYIPYGLPAIAMLFGTYDWIPLASLYHRSGMLLAFPQQCLCHFALCTVCSECTRHRVAHTMLGQRCASAYMCTQGAGVPHLVHGHSTTMAMRLSATRRALNALWTCALFVCWHSPCGSSAAAAALSWLL
jgi:hypothetical protein